MTDGDAERDRALALRAADGDDVAFEQLVAAIWRPLQKWLAGSRRMRALGRSDDVVHDVCTRVLEKLRREDYRSLRTYPEWQERHPEKSFHDWLRIVSANTVRDYARELRGRSTGEEGAPSRARLLNEVAAEIPIDELGARPPVTDAQTARQLLEFAGGRLPPEQLEVLHAWLEGASFEEIAGRHALPGRDDARRSLRAAIAVLRREFARPG